MSRKIIGNSKIDDGRPKNSATLYVWAAVVVLSVIFILSTQDAGKTAAVRMLIMCLATAFLYRPLLVLCRMDLLDGGFSFSLVFGFFISFFLTFLICGFSGNRISFDYPICFISFAFILIVGYILKCKIIKRKYNGSGDNSLQGRICCVYDCFYKNDAYILRFLKAAAAFCVLFALLYWIRGFRAQITPATEQYMDYGFMQMFWRQKAMCPEDIWQCNDTLNYYYLGQAFVTFLCRLSATAPEYGYNLSFAVLFGILGLGSYSLITSILLKLKVGYASIRVAGIVGAIITLCSSNGHFLLYGLIIPLLEKITGKNLNYRDTYWFPDATTYIGNYPDVADKGKTEFPAYSFVLGDLHAHVVSLFFTIFLLALLFEYVLILQTDRCKANGYDENEFTGHGANGRLLSAKVMESVPVITVLTLLLAFFTGSNYWDAPIYFVISGAVILFANLHAATLNNDESGIKKGRAGMYFHYIMSVLILGMIMQLAGWILMLPFSRNFVKMASKIGLCVNHSPFGKMALLWGIPFAIAIVLLVYIIWNFHAKASDAKSIFLYLIVLILCATGLVLVPEVVCVEDIYGADYARFNTMFKLTYQAYVIFCPVTGVAIGLMLDKIRLKKLGIAICIIELLLSGYAINATRNWFGNIFDASERAGISGMEHLADSHETMAELNAISIINDDPRKNIHIMEVGGNSYQPDNKLSVFTGGCDVAGWYVHEWLWHGSSEETAKRHDDIRRFYECGDTTVCEEMLYRYDIDYIFVGPREYTYYAVDEAGFAGCATVVWQNEDGMKLYKRQK